MRPLAIGIFTFLGVLILTQILAYQSFLLSQDSVRTQAEKQANFARYKLTSALSHALSATKTLAYIVKTSGVPTNFDSVAQDIIAANRYIDALELTSGGKITHVFPLAGNEQAIGYDVLSDTRTRQEALKAIEKNELFFAGPFMLKQGYSAVVGRLPMHDGRGKFLGFSVVLIKTSTLLEIIETDDASVFLAKANPATGQMEFFSDHNDVSDAHAVAVTVPSGEWILYARLDDDASSLYRFLPISLLGLCLAGVMGVLAWYMAKEPVKVNRLYRFTSDINSMGVNAKDERTVYQQICRIAVDTGKFKLAWVALIDGDQRTIYAGASAGLDDGYLDAILPIDLEGKGKNGPIAQMLRSRSMVYCNNIRKEPLMKVWAGEALLRGYRSSILLPIVQFGQIIGSFNLYSSLLNAFDRSELKLLDAVGKDISYTLENLAKARALQHSRTLVELEKEKSDSIINSLPGIFYMYDRQGRFVRWNKTFEQVSGYSGSEIATMTPLDFFHPDDKVLLGKRIGEVFDAGFSEVTADFYTKDKRRIPYYFNGRKVEFEGVQYLIGMGVDITLRVEAESEVQASINEISRLNDYLQNLREEERTSISREIHDVLGQHLTGIKMDTLWLAKNFSANGQAEERIRDMSRLIDETITVVRKVSSQLRPVILDDLGLIAALEWQAMDFEKRTNIATSFISNAAELPLPQAWATNIFRIYQEALTNIARHAHATKVDSTIEISDSGICLTIADDGQGIDENERHTSRTLGMKGMMERAKLFNGKIEFLRNTPTGTIVKVVFSKIDQAAS